MNVKEYLKRNKRRSILTILGISLSSALLLSIGILFSSFREYLIDRVKSEIGDYHVAVKGTVDKKNYIEKLNYEEETYFITYKNIYNTYRNTDKLCSKNKCENITYNTHLLSLYGMSKDKNDLSTIKKIMYFLVISLSVILFFIVYNSFKVSLNSRRKDICHLKLIGYTNSDICGLLIKEAIYLGIIGIITGFIISIFINCAIIDVLNRKLYEVFEGNLNLKLYLPFIIIPSISIFLIVLSSSIIPLRRVKRFKIMELFRMNTKTDNIKVHPFKNFVIWLSVMNYARQREKYRSLIICIFISCLSVSVFSLFLKYGLKSLKEFVIVPKYDLKITIQDEYDMDKIIKKLEPTKYLSFKSCRIIGKIDKDSYLKDYRKEENILITNLGKNTVINKIDKIEREDKITHLKYERFKKIDEITTGDVKLGNLKLTSKVPMGFEDVSDVVVNLEDDAFTNLCDEYENNLVLTTNFKGIDDYLEDLSKTKDLNITYINAKKIRKIIESLIQVLKLFLYGICIMIALVMLALSINISCASTMYRKAEFARLKSIGFESYKIIMSLITESLIVSFKGWFYAIPFVFIINKYFYISVNRVFTFGKIILGMDIIFVNLIISSVIVGLSVTASYLLNRKNMIDDIK